MQIKKWGKTFIFDDVYHEVKESEDTILMKYCNMSPQVGVKITYNAVPSQIMQEHLTSVQTAELFQ